MIPRLSLQRPLIAMRLSCNDKYETYYSDLHLAMTEYLTIFYASWPKKHIFKHGVVCNQNIGAELLHFKTSYQFCIPIVRNMFSVIEFFKEFIKIFFGR